MKKFLISLCSFLLVTGNSCFSQTGDTTLNYLWSINLDNYKNKPVDTFLAKIPNGYLNFRILSPGNPKIAQVLSIEYTDDVYAWIYVYNFQFMNPRSETMTWDMSLFRKENVDHIEVWKGVDCYNGCPDDAPSVAKPPRGTGRN